MNTEEKFDQARLSASCIPVIEEKIKLIEQELVAVMKNTAYSDDKARRNMVTALQICEKVLEYLKSDISDAEYAQKTLKAVSTVDRTLKDRIANNIP